MRDTDSTIEHNSMAEASEAEPITSVDDIYAHSEPVGENTAPAGAETDPYHVPPFQWAPPEDRDGLHSGAAQKIAAAAAAAVLIVGGLFGAAHLKDRGTDGAAHTTIPAAAEETGAAGEGWGSIEEAELMADDADIEEAELLAADEDPEPTITNPEPVTATTAAISPELAAENKIRHQLVILARRISEFSQLEPNPLPDDATVADLWAEADQEASQIRARLNQIQTDIDQLRRSIDNATHQAPEHVADLADAARQGADAAEAWVNAQLAAADPTICRDTLPADARTWPVRRLGDYQPYVDCVEAETGARLGAVAEAAENAAGKLQKAIDTP